MLVLDAGGRRLPIAVNESHAGLLADRRVLVTVFKDYPLPWIRDWATFYVRLHGADAVLLYDNGSESYTSDDVAAALSDIPGLREVVIVSWPFRYGMGGRPGEPALEFLPDRRIGPCPALLLSACQVGSQRRHRRIGPARRGVHIRAGGDEPLCRHALSGVWAEAPGIDSVEALRRVRHRDCGFAWQSQMNMFALGRAETLCRTKWVAVPSRCREDIEWGIHDIYPANKNAHATQRSWRMLDRSIAYRHCRQINTGWKTDRWRSSADFDEVCSLDLEMAACVCPRLRRNGILMRSVAPAQNPSAARLVDPMTTHLPDRGRIRRVA